MKLHYIMIVSISGSLAAHTMQDRFITSFWHNIQTSIESHFSSEKKPSPTKPCATHSELPMNAFQKLFRETITFTHDTRNILTEFAHEIIVEIKEKMLSAEEAMNRFIEKIEHGGTSIMKRILSQTLAVDLDVLIPSLHTIQEKIATLQNDIPLLNQSTLKAQAEKLIHYLHITQSDAQYLQHAGITALTSSLASHLIFGTEDILVTKFHELYHVYPTVIEKVNELKIKDAGLIVHNLFNTSSELVEDIIALHNATGKIGKIMVDDALIYPLEGLKNQIRKLGNSIEFVTSSEPVIVVAPPNSTKALLELLKTCMWSGGIALKDSALQSAQQLQKHIEPIMAKLNPLLKETKMLQRHINDMPAIIHTHFVNTLKASPAFNIPIAPTIALDALEKEIQQIKSEIIQLFHSSLFLIYHSAEAIRIGSELLSYINQFMGATKEQPFINHDIIRGIGFIAEDAVGFTTIVINISDALKAYNPILFREEEIV